MKNLIVSAFIVLSFPLSASAAGWATIVQTAANFCKYSVIGLAQPPQGLRPFVWMKGREFKRAGYHDSADKLLGFVSAHPDLTVREIDFLSGSLMTWRHLQDTSDPVAAAINQMLFDYYRQRRAILSPAEVAQLAEATWSDDFYEQIVTDYKAFNEI